MLSSSIFSLFHTFVVVAVVLNLKCCFASLSNTTTTSTTIEVTTTQTYNATTKKRAERSPRNGGGFNIIDNEAAIFDGLTRRNGSKKYARSLQNNYQRAMRASSFRLDDNGSHLNYLRNPTNAVYGNREAAGRYRPFEDDSAAEAGLFCYQQAVQDSSPNIKKCSSTDQNACMILENSRLGVREMSCTTLNECEMTQSELMRRNANKFIKLSCCVTSLCNKPGSAKEDSRRPVSPPSSSNLFEKYQSTIGEGAFMGSIQGPQLAPQNVASKDRLSRFQNKEINSRYQNLNRPIGDIDLPMAGSALLNHPRNPQSNLKLEDESVTSLVNRVLGGNTELRNSPTASLKQKMPSSYGLPNPGNEDFYRQMMMYLQSQGQQIRKSEQPQLNLPELEAADPLAAKVCNFPPLMPNAWVSVSSLEVGSEVFYQCSTGFQLDGSRVVSCIDSPAEGKPPTMDLRSQPRWSRVPSCIRIRDTQLGDKLPSPPFGRNSAPRLKHRKTSSRNSMMAETAEEQFGLQNIPKQSQIPSTEMTMPYVPDGAENSNLNLNTQSNSVPDSPSSDRVTQCYDNRAGSVFVASCRGDAVICTRIVTTGSSAMSLVTDDSVANNEKGEGQQISQYCALLDDCLRFERWVRLANRDDIDVLCCSTDLCNA